MKKIILILFILLLPIVIAENISINYGYDYFNSVYLPISLTPDGWQNVNINLLNLSAGNLTLSGCISMIDGTFCSIASINQSGSTGGGNSTQEIINAVNGTALNLSNSFGYSWNNLLDRLITSVSSWFIISTGELNLNESKLNITIKELSINETFANDTYYNIKGDTLEGNMDVNNYNITYINSLGFNVTVCTNIDDLSEGTLCWNPDQKTVNVVRGNGQVYQIGKEMGDDGINNDTTLLYDGTVVCMIGFQGDNPKFVRGDGTNISQSSFCGILTGGAEAGQPCNVNDLCPVTVFGFINNIDTSAWTTGMKLYLNPNELGNLTEIKPSLPNNPTWYATVGRISETVGTIFVSPQIDMSDGFLINDIWVTNNVVIENNLSVLGNINVTGNIEGEVISARTELVVRGINLSSTSLNHTSGADQIGIPVLNGATYRTVHEFINMFGSSGRIEGGEITEGGMLVNVSSGSGFIKATDNDTAEIMSFSWEGVNGFSIPTNSIMYFGIDYNNSEPVIVNKTTDTWDLDTQFPLGQVINQAGELYVMNNPWWVGDGLTNVIERFQAQGWLTRDENIGGLILGVTGTRNPTMTAGTLWSRLTEHKIPAFNSATGDTFDYYYRDGAGGYIEISDRTQYNVTKYDTGTGTLQNLNNNYYAVIWVWVNVASKKISLIFPQAQYVNAASAEAEEIPNTYPAQWYKGGIIIGRIIIKQGQDAPVEVQSVFTQTFTAAQAADHANLANLDFATSGHTGFASLAALQATNNTVKALVLNNITLNTKINSVNSSLTTLYARELADNTTQRLVIAGLVASNTSQALLITGLTQSNISTNLRIDGLLASNTSIWTAINNNATKLDNLQISHDNNVTKIDLTWNSLLSNVTKLDNLQTSFNNNVTKIDNNAIRIDSINSTIQGLKLGNTTQEIITAINGTSLNLSNSFGYDLSSYVPYQNANQNIDINDKTLYSQKIYTGFGTNDSKINLLNSEVPSSLISKITLFNNGTTTLFDQNTQENTFEIISDLADATIMGLNSITTYVPDYINYSKLATFAIHNSFTSSNKDNSFYGNNDYILSKTGFKIGSDLGDNVTFLGNNDVLSLSLESDNNINYSNVIVLDLVKDLGTNYSIANFTGLLIEDFCDGISNNENCYGFYILGESADNIIEGNLQVGKDINSSSRICDGYGNCLNTVTSTGGNTTQEIINAANSTGLLINWNSSGYIKNWNSTGLLINWSNVIIDTNETIRVDSLIQSNISTNLRIDGLLASNTSTNLRIDGLFQSNISTNLRIDGLVASNTSTNLKIEAVNSSLISNYVPYTGATTDVDLGTNKIFAGVNSTIGTATEYIKIKSVDFIPEIPGVFVAPVLSFNNENIIGIDKRLGAIDTALIISKTNSSGTTDPSLIFAQDSLLKSTGQILYNINNERLEIIPNSNYENYTLTVSNITFSSITYPIIESFDSSDNSVGTFIKNGIALVGEGSATGVLSFVNSTGQGGALQINSDGDMAILGSITAVGSISASNGGLITKSINQSLRGDIITIQNTREPTSIGYESNILFKGKTNGGLFGRDQIWGRIGFNQTDITEYLGQAYFYIEVNGTKILKYDWNSPRINFFKSINSSGDINSSSRVCDGFGNCLNSITTGGNSSSEIYNVINNSATPINLTKFGSNNETIIFKTHDFAYDLVPGAFNVPVISFKNSNLIEVPTNYGAIEQGLFIAKLNSSLPMPQLLFIGDSISIPSGGISYNLDDSRFDFAINSNYDYDAFAIKHIDWEGINHGAILSRNPDDGTPNELIVDYGLIVNGTINATTKLNTPLIEMEDNGFKWTFSINGTGAMVIEKI